MPAAAPLASSPAEAFFSSTSTSKPAAASSLAMPSPMMPAPMIRAFFISGFRRGRGRRRGYGRHLSRKRGLGGLDLADLAAFAHEHAVHVKLAPAGAVAHE